MQSDTELAKLIKAQRPDLSQGVDELVGIIQAALAANPALIKDLMPNMVLSRRPMTPIERAKTAVPAMNTAKSAYRKELINAVAPIVHDLRRSKPNASGHEIAKALNQTFHCPSKSRGYWTYVDVRRLTKELNIELEPSST